MIALSEGIGYFILLGVGLVMAIAVSLIVRTETKWLGTKKTFEWFSTAGRNVKVGLIASSVVSAWTWAATLLQSSTVAYQYGISGPFWYAAGASIQVVLFAILALELKRKAPSSHTFPEIIHARFGKNSHKVFLFFALLTNTVVTAMLVLGGAAAVTSLTGVNIYTAAFLIPAGIIIYTFFGGLKATFLAEYMNTSFLFVVVLIFVSAVYFTNPQIGGISGMFEKLTAAAASRPIDGNAAGSYLTLASTGALIFGVVNIVGNFGTVFVDQAYWQRAIAAGPRAAFRGFLIGGMAWFAIPFALATTLGLAAVAINLNLTPQEISMGLVAPNAAYNILGDVGAILILAILFTAVTSAGSAELVAVSSLVTYDVYRTYTKPSSTGRELMRISRLSIVVFGMGMGVLALILLQIGVSLQYMYLAMGILIGSAVVPVALAVMWNKTNKNAATIGAIAGLACGLASWFGTAYLMAGEITINSTSHEVPLLVGNITSILVGAAIVLLGSKIRPEHFDFDLMKQKIVMVDGRIRELFGNDNDEYLRKSSRVGYKVAIALTLIMVVAWPMPLYLSGYVFSEGTYFLWIGIAVTWASVAAAVIIFMPLIESRAGILQALHIIKTETSAKAGELARENRWPDYSGAKDSELPSKKILVAIDGSRQSLHALNYAMGLYNDPGPSRVFLLHVIEWAEETEEPLDEEMTTKMEKEGRLLLNSLVMPKLSSQVVKIIKVGDPATKITEVADSIGASIIIMGSSGLGNSEELGNVTRKVLKLASRPVVLMK